MDSARLLHLKERIEEHKLTRAKEEGVLEQLKTDLKENHKVKNLKEAKAKLKKMGEAIDKRQEQLETKKEKLIEKYEAQV